MGNMEICLQSAQHVVLRCSRSRERCVDAGNSPRLCVGGCPNCFPLLFPAGHCSLATIDTNTKYTNTQIQNTHIQKTQIQKNKIHKYKNCVGGGHQIASHRSSRLVTDAHNHTSAIAVALHPKCLLLFAHPSLVIDWH